MEIAKWAETFEGPESRRPKSRMEWYSHPVDLMSRGTIELTSRGNDGLIALAVFNLLCQWTAGQAIDKRGNLTHSNGDALNGEYLSKAINVSKANIEKSLEILKEIGWIDQVRSSSIKSDQVRSSSIKDDQVRSSSIKDDQVCSLHNRTEQDTTGQDMTQQESFERFWDHVPRKKNKANALKAWKAIPAADQAKAIEAIKVWAKSGDAVDSVRGSIHMATWLNQKRYEDDPSTWEAIPEQPRKSAAQIESDAFEERMKAINALVEKQENAENQNHKPRIEATKWN